MKKHCVRAIKLHFESLKERVISRKNGPYTKQYSCEHGSIHGNLNRVKLCIHVNTNLVYRYRTSLRLKKQSFEIRFGFKLQIGTPLHQNLLS